MKQILTLILMFTAAIANGQDWANLNRYKQANAELAPKNGTRTVFMGNSITDGWASERPEFFSANGYVGRGISGQTTPQMLVRFRQDVVSLGADRVVILAGTNDIAGNTGPSTLEMIVDNIASMCDIAKANGIRPVICSVLPAQRYSWNPEIRCDILIPKLNALLEKYADENAIQYVDFFTKMVDDKQGLPVKYSQDGVHPTVAGYEVMESIIVPALVMSL